LIDHEEGSVFFFCPFGLFSSLATTFMSLVPLHDTKSQFIFGLAGFEWAYLEAGNSPAGHARASLHFTCFWFTGRTGPNFSQKLLSDNISTPSTKEKKIISTPNSPKQR